MWLEAEGVILLGSGRVSGLSLVAFGHEMLTQSPSYTGLLSSSLDTQMTPRAGDQAGIQQAPFPMCRKQGIQGEKCLPPLEGILGGVTK